MGRIRTLKPEFFRSRSLAKCSRDARLTFQGLWCEADDYGRGIADTRILKGTLWPLDDEITPEVVDTHLHELSCTGHIRLYEVDGDRFYAVIAWEIHQAAAYRRGHAVYPEPLPENACTEVQAAPLDVQMRAGTRNEERGTGSEEVAPNGAAPQKRKTAMTPDWQPSDSFRAWLQEHYPQHNRREVLDQFRDHWLAKGERRADWDRSLMTWVRNEEKYRGEQSGAARTFL